VGEENGVGSDYWCGGGGGGGGGFSRRSFHIYFSI